MAHFQNINLGNVLGQAENIKGLRTQNILGQQKIDANVLLQQRAAQFSPLAQNVFADPSQENIAAAFAVDPEGTQAALAAIQSGQGVEGTQQGIDQEEAQIRIGRMDQIIRSASPLARARTIFSPEEIQAFEQAAGSKLDTDEEALAAAQQIRTGLQPFAGPEFAQAEATLEATRVGIEGAQQGQAISASAEARAGRTEVRNIAKERVLAKRADEKATREAAAAARAVTKAQTEQAKAVARVKSSIADTRSTQATMARLATHPGLSAATGKSSLLPTVPGSAKADFLALVDTAKARVGFAELAKMRASSPTGGALGQISERELTFLQAANQSLATSQSEEQFVANVTLIDESLQRLLGAQNEALASAAAQGFPEGTIDNGDGTFKLPDGRFIRKKSG